MGRYLVTLTSSTAPVRLEWEAVADCPLLAIARALETISEMYAKQIDLTVVDKIQATPVNREGG